MAFFFHNPQRRVLPQAIEALQQLQDNPQQLDHERDQRYNEPPPPYSESGETTQPPTPGPPIVDEYYERDQRERARAKSKPLVQFKSQAKRERKRLEHQLSEERFGRRQTLPWDNSSDLRANSENVVRSRWVEQGIWGDEWGPAWPTGSVPMSTRMAPRGDGPFYGRYNSTTNDKFPGARWGHEKHDTDPEPEPEPEPEQPRALGPWIWNADAHQPKRPTSPQPIGYIQTPLGPLPQYPIPKPTVRKPEASRPYHQFLYQISEERNWIKDEIDYQKPGGVIDLDAIAYQSVKNNWIEDGIWDPKWDELPGMTWIHEEPEEEEVVEAPTASDHAGGRPPDAADDDRQQSHGSRYPNLFMPAPILEATNGRTDDSPPPASGGTEVSNAERHTGGRNRGVLGRQPAITDVAQDPVEAPRRSLRIARSPKAENRGNPSSSAAKVQVQGNPSAGPAKTPKPTRGGTRGRPGRRRGDALGKQSSKSQDLDVRQNLSPSDRSVAPASRQPKRSCSYNTIEDQHPLKRPRYNGQDPDSRTVITRNVGDVKTLAGNKKAVLTSGETEGMRIRAVSNPRRRSARIAEREKQLRVAAELQKRRSRSPPTKTAKRGRPTRGSEHGRSKPK